MKHLSKKEVLLLYFENNKMRPGLETPHFTIVLTSFNFSFFLRMSYLLVSTKSCYIMYTHNLCVLLYNGVEI